METQRPSLLYFVSEAQEPTGALHDCLKTASSFKVQPEAKLCWISAWGACQVGHAELVSPWLCHLPALLPASEAPGIVVGWEWQVYYPPSPPAC